MFLGNRRYESYEFLVNALKEFDNGCGTITVMRSSKKCPSTVLNTVRLSHKCIACQGPCWLGVRMRSMLR